MPARLVDSTAAVARAASSRRPSVAIAAVLFAVRLAAPGWCAATRRGCACGCGASAPPSWRCHLPCCSRRGAGSDSPAYHSADRVPAPLLYLADALTPRLAPVQSAQLGPGATALCLLAALPAIWLCVLQVRRGLGIEQWLAHDEASRRAADPDDVPAGLGFFKGALFAFCVTSIVGGVLLGGAIADWRWRLELLATHARALRGAEITLNEAAPRNGQALAHRRPSRRRPDPQHQRPGPGRAGLRREPLRRVGQPDDVRGRPGREILAGRFALRPAHPRADRRRPRTSTHTRCVRESRSSSPTVSVSKSTSTASASRPAALTTFPCPRSFPDGASSPC